MRNLIRINLNLMFPRGLFAIDRVRKLLMKTAHKGNYTPKLPCIVTQRYQSFLNYALAHYEK